MTYLLRYKKNYGKEDLKVRSKDGTYYLLFKGSDSEININTKKPEFKNWKWVSNIELIKKIVPFKRELYKAVLDEFKDYLV